MKFARFFATLIGFVLTGAFMTPLAAKPARLPPQVGRIALVIGVENYGPDASLRTPLNDLKLVSSALTDLGFDVRPLKDPNRAELDKALDLIQRDAADRQSRGIDTTLVVYFAGHGVVVNDRAYLLTRDFRVTGMASSAKLDPSALPLEDLASRMQNSGARRVLIVIDACRNNPWERGTPRVAISFESSVARQEAALVLSASTGGTAVDAIGDEANSPFAIDFSRAIVDDELPNSSAAIGRTIRAVEIRTSNRPKPQLGIMHGSFNVALTRDDSTLLRERQAAEAPLVKALSKDKANVDQRASSRTTLVSTSGARRLKREVILYLGDPCPTSENVNNPTGRVYRYLDLFGIDRLRDRANAGIRCEQYLLGIYYTLPGWADRLRAIDYLERAAKSSEPRALTALSWVYTGGEGDWPIDEQQLLLLNELARKMGIGGPLRNYAALVRDGYNNVAGNPSRAALLFEEAAKLGDGRAAELLAEYYSERRYNKVNIELARTWYEYSLGIDNFDACACYGSAIFFGSNSAPDFKIDKAAALDVWQRGAKRGSVESLMSLGYVYENEAGYVDPQKAYFAYLDAAKAGHLEAMIKVGDRLRDGIGVTVNKSAATQWYETARKGGEPDGSLRLAKLAEADGDMVRAVALNKEVLSFDSDSGSEAVWPMTFVQAGQKIQSLSKEKGVPPIDPTYLKWLERTYGKAGNMKKFPFPILCGSTKISPDVYIFDWERAASPTEAQFRWYESVRACIVPEAVKNGYAKLYQIAGENNVSFTDLTVYALSAAEDSAKDGTDSSSAKQAMSIVAAMRANQFERTKELSTDEAGIILGGFDAVNYFDESKAVVTDGRFFALWRGAIWLFANDTNLQKFLVNPERYLPAYGGYCAACAADGSVTIADPRQFVVHEGVLYLFSNDTTRKRWLENPTGYIRRGNQQWAEKKRAGLIAAEASPGKGTKLGNAIVEALRISAMKDSVTKAKP